MAAGFTVAAGAERDFRAFLAERIRSAAGSGGIVPRLGIDGAVQPAGATTELAATLLRLAPFGAGNPEPRFVLPAARIVRADPIGVDPVRCFLTGESGGRLPAVRPGERRVGTACVSQGRSWRSPQH